MAHFSRYNRLFFLVHNQLSIFFQWLSKIVAPVITSLPMDRYGRDRMVVEFTTLQSMPITINVVSSNLANQVYMSGSLCTTQTKKLTTWLISDTIYRGGTTSTGLHLTHHHDNRHRLQSDNRGNGGYTTVLTFFLLAFLTLYFETEILFFLILHHCFL